MEERFDWTLLLERESFFALCASLLAFAIFVLLRFALGWYADHRLKIPRFRLHAHLASRGCDILSRAGDQVIACAEFAASRLPNRSTEEAERGCVR